MVVRPMPVEARAYELNGLKGKIEARIGRGSVEIDWVIIIVPSRLEEGASMNSEVSYGVVEDSEDGVVTVARDGEGRV